MLFACGSDSDAFSRCEDADCRVFAVVEAFDGTTESVVPLLLRLEDPAELTVAMNRLREADPKRMGEICDLLPKGDARRKCHRVHSRPHLEGESRANLDVVKLDMPSGGPSSRGVLRRSRSRFSWVTPVSSDCAAGPAMNTCVTGLAQKAASAGQRERAGALCASLPRGDGRDGCMAQVGMGQDELLDGIDFCLAAGARAWSCLGGMIDGLVRAHREFGALATAIAGVYGALEERASGLADLMVDRIWARSLGGAYAGALEGPGLVGLPAEALPHHRAAAARLLVTRMGPGSMGLDAWVERLIAFMEEVGPKNPGLGSAMGEVSDGWGQDLKGEESREARLYLDGSRRGVSGDLRTDMAVCVLEAAARLEPPDLALLREGEAREDPLLKWTAQRLLSVVDGTRASADEPWGEDHWSVLPGDRAGTHHDDPNYGKNPPVPGVP